MIKLDWQARQIKRSYELTIVMLILSSLMFLTFAWISYYHAKDAIQELERYKSTHICVEAKGR